MRNGGRPMEVQDMMRLGAKEDQAQSRSQRQSSSRRSSSTEDELVSLYITNWRWPFEFGGERRGAS
jgi:hypothetical protein